jgi:hypothetical protein
VLEADEGMSVEDRLAELEKMTVEEFSNTSSEEKRELFKQSYTRKLLWELDHMDALMKGMTLEDRREVLNAMIEAIRSHRLFSADYKA